MLGLQNHTVVVPYPPYSYGRTMECISVADFENNTPFDLREILPHAKAKEELEIAAVGLTRHILDARQSNLGEAYPIPNISRVGSFIKRLGLEPIGRISLLDSLEIDGQLITSPGITSAFHRQSFIIRDNISKSHSDPPPLPSKTK